MKKYGNKFDSELINTILLTYNLSQYKLAEKLNEHRTYIQQILNQSRAISEPLKQKILVSYPDIYKCFYNVPDISPVDSKNNEADILHKNQNLNVDDCVWIDEILDIYQTCKSSVFVPPKTMLKVCVPHSSIINYSPDISYLRFTVMGDDMSPEINNGDKLTLKVFDDETDCIENNAIYAIRYDRDFFVRRLVKNINRISIIADNPAPEYETIVLETGTPDFKKLTVIGKIINSQRIY